MQDEQLARQQATRQGNTGEVKSYPSKVHVYGNTEMQDTPAKSIGVVFSTLEGCPCAQSILQRQFAQDVVVWAPFDLLPKEWCSIAMANYYHREYRNLVSGNFDSPIRFLARIDELFVVAENQGDGNERERKTAEGLEDLLWLSLEFQIPSHFVGIDCNEITLTDDYFSNHPAMLRNRLAREARQAYTQSLTAIRVEGEYFTDGLCSGQGSILSFDCLDLPHLLMRRLAAWQEDWENIPQGVVCETRWDANLREETAIARELQRVLGPGTRVLVDRDGQWCWIEEVLESTAPEENSLDLAG